MPEAEESEGPSDSSTPADFGATSTESGPFWEATPESPVSGQHDDSHPAAEATESRDTETEDEETLPEFDEQYRQDFIGLTFIGKLSETFTWMGHTFKIRSLLTYELIEVGLVHAKYQGSVADVKAYQSAVVGACVETLDGQPLPVPITKDVDLVEERFNYVKLHWYPWTVDAVYERYLLLEARVERVIEAMGKALGSAA